MPSPSGQKIDRVVERILERDEFSALKDRGGSEVEAIAELFTSLMQAIDAFVGDLRTNHPGLFVLLLVAGTAVLGVAIWYGARGAARRSYADAQVQERIPEVLKGDPRSLRAEAEKCAAAGRYLDAVRLLFRAAIIEQALSEGSLESLRDAGRFRRARTYRELVEEFARGSAMLERMRGLAERIERGLYAEEELDASDYEQARTLGARS